MNVMNDQNSDKVLERNIEIVRILILSLVIIVNLFIQLVWLCPKAITGQIASSIGEDKMEALMLKEQELLDFYFMKIESRI